MSDEAKQITVFDSDIIPKVGQFVTLSGFSEDWAPGQFEVVAVKDRAITLVKQ